MAPPLEHHRTKSDPPGKRSESLRCCCGSLLARVVEGGVELKCRRCKRHVVVPLHAKEAGKNTM